MRLIYNFLMLVGIGFWIAAVCVAVAACSAPAFPFGPFLLAIVLLCVGTRIGETGAGGVRKSKPLNLSRTAPEWMGWAVGALAFIFVFIFALGNMLCYQ